MHFRSAVLAVALECQNILQDCFNYKTDVRSTWKHISDVLHNNTILGTPTKDSIEKHFHAQLLQLNAQRGSASNKRERTHDIHPGPDLGIRDVPSPVSGHLVIEDRPLVEASSSLAGPSRYADVVFPDMPQGAEDQRDGDAPAKKTRRRSRTPKSQAIENRSGPSEDKGKGRALLLITPHESESEDSSSSISNESDESGLTLSVFDEDEEETASDISDVSSQQQVEDLIVQVRTSPCSQRSIVSDIVLLCSNRMRHTSCKLAFLQTQKTFILCRFHAVPRQHRTIIGTPLLLLSKHRCR